MDFSEVLEAMKEGKKVRRPSMKGDYIELVFKIHKGVLDEEPCLRSTIGKTIIDDFSIPVYWLFLNDWEIVG